MLSAQLPPSKAIAAALERKARSGAPGVSEGNMLAAGDGWRVVDILCTAGPRDRSFEEQHRWASISLVLSGTFIYHGERGSSLLAPGAMLLGNPGNTFECSHEHGEGDRCLSFQYDAAVFDQVAHAAGAPRFAFAVTCLPPLRAMAPLFARAAIAMQRQDSFDEIALELAGGVMRTAGHSPRIAPALRNTGAIARVLRLLECRTGEPHSLDELARAAGLSRYHFLRTFKDVTGVTPHQWLLRSRLRHAADLLATSRAPVTQIALDAGFEDLSNFIRSFRAQYGVPPRTYRARA